MIDKSRFNDSAQIKLNLGKAGNSNNGEISGYAALWDVQDLDGDVIRKGAFARSINNQITAGKVMLMVRHFRDNGDVMESVGKIIEAREDNVGFWVRAKLDSTQNAQELRDKIILSPNAFGMSVGWRNAENGFSPIPGGKGFEYTEMNLKEVTVTLKPIQDDTIGTVKAKSADNLEDRIVQAVLDRLENRDESQNSESTDNTVGEKSENTVTAVEEDDFDEIAHLKRVLYLIKKRRGIE